MTYDHDIMQNQLQNDKVMTKERDVHVIYSLVSSI